MNIFLSYASEDRSTAEAIAFSLRDRGHEVFLDRDGLRAGEGFDKSIEQAVNKSNIFIFLISPESVAEGRYTLTELTFARQKWPSPSGHVLPVRVRTTSRDQIPSYLKAVTILEPDGNVAAETSAKVDEMGRGRNTKVEPENASAELRRRKWGSAFQPPSVRRFEKTVFISYRRTDEPWALAVFNNLTHHGYDVFIDFDGIASSNFEAVILENIRARAHFLVLLTPTALERRSDPQDWFRREIESALDSRRNIVPLLLEGANFRTPAIARQLTGKLAALTQYHALSVPSDYFPAAMERLRTLFLSGSVDIILEPASASARQAAVEQNIKASRALERGPEASAKARAQAQGDRIPAWALTVPISTIGVGLGVVLIVWASTPSYSSWPLTTLVLAGLAVLALGASYFVVSGAARNVLEWSASQLLRLQLPLLGGNVWDGGVGADRGQPEGGAARNVTRHINAWIEGGLPPLHVGRSYRLGLNIGPLRERALAAAVFTEPRSQDQESLKLLVVLSGSGFRVEPRQHQLVLPRRGSTETIFFSLTPLRAGRLTLCVSFYLARELALVQEFEVPIEAGSRDEPARFNVPSPRPAEDRRQNSNA
jgi:hypothetical protein